jgi:hypothetical protein
LIRPLSKKPASCGLFHAWDFCRLMGSDFGLGCRLIVGANALAKGGGADPMGGRGQACSAIEIAPIGKQPWLFAHKKTRQWRVEG